MVPNIDGTIGHKIKTRKHPRHGTLCIIQYPTNRNPAQSLQENTITVFGPRLYNSLPKYLSDIESVKTEKFKSELERFLELILDKPKMPNYVTASGSNSILNQLTHLRAQGIYRSGGVLDSAMEQSWLLWNHSKYPSIWLDLFPYDGTGSLDMFPHFCRRTTDVLARRLSVVFQRLVCLGSFPACWRQAHVTPVLKGPLTSCFANY